MRYFSYKEYGGPAEARDAARDCIIDVVSKKRRKSDGNLTKVCIKECNKLLESF